MIQILRSKDRGHVNHGWLKAKHTFSFGDYHNPSHMGFRDLRVINEDQIQGGQGFGTHPHRDMEIITYMIEGALEHKDSMGNGSVIHPGEVQYMSAGKGVMHSEFNASKTELAHLLQIWILPNERSATPRYNQKSFSPESRTNQLKRLVSPDGKDESIAIRQNVSIFGANFLADFQTTFDIKPGRHAWLQIVKGTLDVNGNVLNTGDGAAVSEVAQLKLKTLDGGSEFLIFDLA